MVEVEGISGEVGELGVNDDFKILVFTLGMSIFLFTKTGHIGGETRF